MLGVVGVIGALATSAASCTPALRNALRESMAEKTRCAIRNMNLPNEEILKRCLIEGAPEDIARILSLLGTAREQAASAALAAAARQRDLDEKVGVCRPEKTSAP